MRIALVNLTSGGLSGGYRKYLRVLPPLLAAHPDVSGVEVLSPAGMRYEESPGIAHWRWPARDGWRGYPALRQHIEDSRPDVVFIPTSRIVRTPFPTVVMVRNMEPLVTPFAVGSMRDVARNLALRSIGRSSCRRADRVIAVSEFVRDYLMSEWKLEESKVAVISHGIEAPVPAEACLRPSAMTERRFQHVIFTAGTIRPARGLEDVLAATARLVARGLDVGLLVAGEISRGAERYYRRLQRFCAASGIEDHVIWLGALSRLEVGWCFRNSDAFVMTSRVEACPNTALEAMSYGAFSIATRNRPMPDVFENAARYYHAGDDLGLSHLLTARFQDDQGARDAAEVIARARAATFSWARTADDTVAQLRRAIESRGGRRAYGDPAMVTPAPAEQLMAARSEREPS